MFDAAPPADDDPFASQLMAADIVQHVALVELAALIAAAQSAPEQWVRSFIASLHADLDRREEAHGRPGQRYPVYELARLRVDRLAAEVRVRLLVGDKS